MVYGKKIPDSGFSGDDGSAHPEVTEALAGYQAGRLGKSDLVEALINRRLMVAVLAIVEAEGPAAARVSDEPAPRREPTTGRVADRSMAAGRYGEPGEAPVGVKPHAGPGFQVEKAAEVMLITIKGSDGRSALPAFTSLDALSRWKADARPVPASTPRVCAGALYEGADLVVIDPAGPTTVELSGAVLWALAESRALVPLAEDPAVIGAIQEASEGMARAFSDAFLQPGADQGTDLVIQLVARPGATAAELREAASQLASRLAANPIIRSRVDGGVQIAAVHAPPPGGLRV
jgi:type III secretion system (T3SS) SseB-like protein